MPEKVNKNQVERTTNSGTKEKFPTQPVVAIVRNHLDSTYMGNLEVEILTSSNAGQSTNAPGQIIPVRYLSPFHGNTSLEGANKNEGAANSQRSYGWWGVPPDIGAKVLVIFAEGGDGYWLGCIPEDHTNIMTPDPWVSTTFNDSDRSKKLPVVEYNKKTESGTGRNSTKFIKPTNQDAVDVLTTQGLIEDEIRGLTTSSSRRELPSAVMGFSSPGPQDKRPGAPRVNYGENFAQTPVPQNRLGGSSLVFDDGDATLVRKTPAKDGPPEYVNIEGGETGGDPTLPHNELVRLRTRTGHQILLHNTEDLIYIANARGTTWIELTSNGKIDIYAKDSISVHTENDMNFTADRDINFNAGRDIHMNAGTNIFQTAGSNWEIKAGSDGKITVGGSSNIRATGNHVETAANIHMNGPAAATAADANVPTRVPQHEPWTGHENLDPASFTPDQTDGSQEEEPQATPTTTPDTFAQNTTRDVREEPNAAPTETEEAPETAPTDGVIQTPEATPGGIPNAVAGALEQVGNAISSVTVGGLINSVVEAGKAITFGVGQAIVGAIDEIAGPGLLSKVSQVPGLGSSSRAAGDLLGLRTTLAKGNVPSTTVPVSDSTSVPSIRPGQDDEIIGDVYDGKYRAGDVVTLSDGRYRVEIYQEETAEFEAGYELVPL
jgi:hypothetical protein